MNNILQLAVLQNKAWTDDGNLADYIPELLNADPGSLGVFVTTCDNQEYAAGDIETKFTMQSLSKVTTLMCALEDCGKSTVFKNIGVEPTSDPFNSIRNLELKNLHRPLNPMINSGAIATVSLLKGQSGRDRFKRVLRFIHELTENPSIQMNEKVYISEKSTAHRNRALAHYMKSNGVIEGDVEEILDTYFRLCSIELKCKDISKIASVLANDGVLPWNDKAIVHGEHAQIVKAIMTTCGMYDASGEFSVEVGIPAKSGVSGGIMAVVPNRMGIGVIGPALDKKGNSVAGIQLLKELSRELKLSIF